MSGVYHLDLEMITLQKFKHNIESREMIPSRVALKDDLDQRFKILEAEEITNLKQLLERLKTKEKIEIFSQETGLSAEYLTLIRREANSYQPNPIRLDKFPGISENHTQMLASEGIKNSRQLFDKASTRKEREALSQKTGVPLHVVDELACLSDLARAYGVGPVFARLIYDLGVKTIEHFVQKTPREIITMYEQKEKKKADFGENEMQFSLNLAKELKIVLEI